MLKRIILLLLCAVMVLSACAQNPEEGMVDAASPGADSDNETGNRGDIPEATPTPAPTPTPTPEPFPDELVEESSGYAFVCVDEGELFYRPESDSTTIKTIPRNTGVMITGEYEEWLRVSVDESEGFMPRNTLAQANAYIIADEVNLRTGAGLDCDIIKKTVINTEIDILERDGDWLKVVLDDEEETVGYMHYEYVDYPEGYIVKNGVNVRSIPDTTGEVVGKLDRGQCIYILFEYNGWYSIYTDEFTGYVSAEFIQEAPIVMSLERQRAYINESGVNFREGPATGFEILDKLYKFTPVYITGETEEWYRVECEDIEGYVSKEFVDIGKPTVYVTGQDVNLRAGPGTGTDILTKVRQNSEFVVIGQEDSWLRGEVNGNVGYIRVDYLGTEPVGDGAIDIEFTEEDVFLAAKVVYLEAKGTGYDGYAAVANVIYNRVKSRKFPNNVRDVVYQKNQFSVINHSNFENLTPNSTALEATRDVLNGGVRPMPLNVLFFFAKHLGNSWGSDKEFYKIVGNNAFFRYVG